MPSSASSALSRRSVLFGAAGLATLAVTGCNASKSAEPVGAASSGASSGSSFSYTDARGATIDLPAVPTTVVAQSSAAAALWDAGFKVKGAYGELKTTDGKLDFQAGNLDLSQLTVIGSTYSEFNIEKYAAMSPQLLVDLSFDDKTLWYVPAESLTKIEVLAPTLGMKMVGKNLVEIVGEFMELATKLGADAAGATATAKTEFEASVDKIKAAVAAQPDLTVLAMSRDADKAYIANADLHPDLKYMKTLGVKFVASDGEDYFTEISYEKLDSYAGDVVFDDSRNYSEKNGTDKQPTWQALSAVKSGQVVPWKAAAPYSYAAYVPIFADYAAALSSARIVN